MLARGNMENNLIVFEVSPNPSRFTLELLDLIYNNCGPVDTIYRKYGIEYRFSRFWKTVNGTLFVDLQIEKKTIPLSLRNLWNLNKIKPERLFDKLRDKLIFYLEDSQKVSSREMAVEKFLKEYQLVFEINFIYQKTQKELEAILRNKIVLNKILIFGSSLIENDDDLTVNLKSDNWVGNSLEINDLSKFRMTDIKKRKDEDLNAWWENVPEFKKQYLQKIIRTALRFERLREMARWLTVKNISEIRKLVKPEDKIVGSKTNKIMDKDLKEQIKGVGVSAGKAVGVIATTQQVDNNSKDKLILYTRVLAPELTDYLSKVVGVIATNGGILSHMAIVAREMGIPVVVNIKEENVNIGDRIEIDGESGIIKSIKT